MAKLKSTLLNMFLSLTIICIVAGVVLAMVNELTTGPINISKKLKLESAIKEVVPDFDNSPTEEMYMASISTNDSLKVYPAKKGGELVGVAVESNSMKGFSGEIKIIVGLNSEGKIIDYAVLEHAETPGLGDKMDPWFKTDKNKQNILGRNLSEGLLRVSKDGGDVDAITAATITSRAFLDAVNRAYMAYSGNIDANTGATNDAASGASKQVDGESGATSDSNSKDEVKTDGESGATSSSDGESSATVTDSEGNSKVESETDSSSGATNAE